MIDTQNKRRAVLRNLPVPDNAITEPDRRQILHLYPFSSSAAVAIWKPWKTVGGIRGRWVPADKRTGTWVPEQDERGRAPDGLSSAWVPSKKRAGTWIPEDGRSGTWSKSTEANQ